MKISTVIAKPTVLCNADCVYCSTPPTTKTMWSEENFSFFLKRLYKVFSDSVVWIWHGGEPLLMGPDFYKKCHEIAEKHQKETGQKIKFSVQTNLLLYNSKTWKEIFGHIFEGRVSTSYDPDEKLRTLKGSASRYANRFKNKLENVLEDGFRPLVIGTFDENTIDYAYKMYDFSKSKPNGMRFNIRINYRYPAGKASGTGFAISPKKYGTVLVDIFDMWIRDNPGFLVTPLDQMLKLVVGLERDRCPWTPKCANGIMEIGPNGDVHTCGEFADLKDDKYRYGNIMHHSGSALLQSEAAKAVRKRVIKIHGDCALCEHYDVCGGGCMRDSVLFGNGIYGKFPYCESWKMVFSHIKKAVGSNEARTVIDFIRSTERGVQLP